jgi:hypothetical protein
MDLLGSTTAVRVRAGLRRPEAVADASRHAGHTRSVSARRPVFHDLGTRPLPEHAFIGPEFHYAAAAVGGIYGSHVGELPELRALAGRRGADRDGKRGLHEAWPTRKPTFADDAVLRRVPLLQRGVGGTRVPPHAGGAAAPGRLPLRRRGRGDVRDGAGSTRRGASSTRGPSQSILAAYRKQLAQLRWWPNEPGVSKPRRSRLLGLGRGVGPAAAVVGSLLYEQWCERRSPIVKGSVADLTQVSTGPWTATGYGAIIQLDSTDRQTAPGC